MTPYYRTAAYRSAVAHPYHVHLYRDWSDHSPVVVGFQTEAEARAFAVSRPEPIIDMVQRDCGMVAARRMFVHPATPTAVFTPSDDFPQTDSETT